MAEKLRLELIPTDRDISTVSINGTTTDRVEEVGIPQSTRSDTVQRSKGLPSNSYDKLKETGTTPCKHVHRVLLRTFEVPPSKGGRHFDLHVQR